MKIHLVSEHASPLALLGGVDAGGQNVHVAHLALGLAHLGAHVVVHTRRDDPALPRRVPFAPRVMVDHVDAGPAAPVPKDELLPHMKAFTRDLRRSWSVERPDVVHSHFWMSGLASLHAARELGVPVAHTHHALGVEKRRHQGAADTSPPARVAIERRISRAAELVIATTAAERRELLAMGAAPHRVVVVPCGVDLEQFRPDGPHAPARTAPARVVIVSRLVARKGIGNVIAAVSRLPGVELLVAGGPPGSSVAADPEAQRFRALARHLGVADRVTLLGGIGRGAVPALLRSGDVVACCPWYEPFGLVAIEAMACGVPVVASEVGGLAESVVDGVTGRHVPPRDPAAIARAIGTLLADDVRRRAMGRAALERAQGYSWERVAGHTYRLLARLAARSRRVTALAEAEAS